MTLLRYNYPFVSQVNKGNFEGESRSLSEVTLGFVTHTPSIKDEVCRNKTEMTLRCKKIYANQI